MDTAAEIDAALRRTFMFTADSSQASTGVVFLKNLADELREEGPGPYLLKEANIDRFLVERISTHVAGDKSVLQYLILCFKRSLQESSRPRASSACAQAILAAQHLIISYAGLVLQTPEMFSQPQPVVQHGPAHMLSFLELDSSHPDAMPWSMVQHLVTRFADDGLPELFGPVFTALSLKMRGTNILGNFLPLFRILASLVQQKQLVHVMIDVPSFAAATVNGRQFEHDSLLGPFFRLTSLPDEPSVGEQLFANPTTQPVADIQSATTAIRASTATLHKLLHEIVLSILKASPRAKEALLDWFAAAISKNQRRTRSMMDLMDMMSTSSDGFFLNLSALLLILCLPFIAPNSNKVSMIDLSYPLRSTRLSFAADTRLAASSDLVSTHKADVLQAGRVEMNFITECFFLTASCVNVGMLPVSRKYTSLIQQLAQLSRNVRHLEETRPLWSMAADAPRHEMQLTECKKSMEGMLQNKLSYEAQLLHPELMHNTLSFCILVAAWLVTHAKPPPDGLPLAAVPPPSFACLPEHLVENVAELLIFIVRFDAQLLQGKPLPELLTFLITFLNAPQYIKNPYLRSKLIEVLSGLVLVEESGQQASVAVGALLETHPMARRFLVPQLLNFYVLFETIGTQNAYYEKFNVRYQIARVMKLLWQSAVFKQSIVASSRDDELFVRFINCILNDCIYVLDESLAGLATIRQLQHDLASASAGTSAQRSEWQEQLSTTEQRVRTWLQLGDETVQMLQYLTTAIRAPFIRPELVDRIALMLDHFLLHLVGPKMKDVKVQNPEQYGFNPRELLTMIATITLNLGSEEQFCRAVARDVRSYSRALHTHAITIFRDRNILSHDLLQSFERFATRTAVLAADEEQNAADLGEVPDEFLDPVSCDLMVDPVRLPSGNIVDRTLITRHLLSDQRDPFNRSPLTLNDLVPVPELKARIDEFVRSRRAARLSTGPSSMS